MLFERAGANQMRAEAASASTFVDAVACSGSRLAAVRAPASAEFGDDCTADQVRAAMAAAPAESMVQQNGAHAISTKRPATTFDDKQTQQAIAMVLEAMVRFPDEGTLQSLSCGAVHALAYHPDGKHSWNNKRALALAGGPVEDEPRV